MSKPIILVVGATGQQGGAVVDELLKSGRFTPRALTRNPDSPSAKRLKDRGAEVFKGSFTDSETIQRGCAGVAGAFLVTTNQVKGGAEAETEQGRLFVDAAKKAGLPFLVFSSVEGAERNTKIPHFDSKYKVEKYIEEADIPHTIIRPVAFSENLPKVGRFARFMVLGLFDAALRGKKIQVVSVKDIAWFAARAFEDPEKYKGRAIPLAEDEVTVSQMQDAYGSVTGVRPWKAWLPRLILRLLPYDVRMMFWWFHSHGYKANIAALREEHTGLIDFKTYVASQTTS